MGAPLVFEHALLPDTDRLGIRVARIAQENICSCPPGKTMAGIGVRVSNVRPSTSPGA
ncbi:MAG: hypothetical protein HY016_09820 [Nitrosomonadales bacterium]|nr:hypothetical protein [Nitrosomonadales bacterium]